MDPLFSTPIATSMLVIIIVLLVRGRKKRKQF